MARHGFVLASSRHGCVLVEHEQIHEARAPAHRVQKVLEEGRKAGPPALRWHWPSAVHRVHLGPDRIRSDLDRIASRPIPPHPAPSRPIPAHPILLGRIPSDLPLSHPAKTCSSSLREARLASHRERGRDLLSLLGRSPSAALSSRYQCAVLSSVILKVAGLGMACQPRSSHSIPRHFQAQKHHVPAPISTARPSSSTCALCCTPSRCSRALAGSDTAHGTPLHSPQYLGEDTPGMVDRPNSIPPTHPTSYLDHEVPPSECRTKGIGLRSRWACRSVSQSLGVL